MELISLKENIVGFVNPKYEELTLNEKPNCRLCGKSENMELISYSKVKKLMFYKCHTCFVETKVPIQVWEKI